MGVLVFKDNLKAVGFFGYFVEVVDQYNVRGPHSQCMAGQQAGRSATASGNLSLLSTKSCLNNQRIHFSI